MLSRYRRIRDPFWTLWNQSRSKYHSEELNKVDYPLLLRKLKTLQPVEWDFGGGGLVERVFDFLTERKELDLPLLRRRR